MVGTILYLSLIFLIGGIYIKSFSVEKKFLTEEQIDVILNSNNNNWNLKFYKNIIIGFTSDSEFDWIDFLKSIGIDEGNIEINVLSN